MTEKAKEFLKELKQVLQKYDGEIEFTCHDCSDTYGLVDDHLVVKMKENGENKTIYKSNGWSLF